MKRFLLVLSSIVWVNFLVAQTEIETTSKKKDWSNVKLTGRAADHFMIQFGYNGWGGTPDSIRNGGFNRTFNMYFLFDFPFGSDPRFSAAIGAGVGTDNMYFKETTIELNRYPLSFTRDTINLYKKFKIATGYLEAPIELRFASNPVNYNKAFKVALGIKVGTMIDAHTKAKIERDSEGYGGYTEKIKDKRNFNTTRLAGTLRVGYSVFSVFGSYQFNEFIKEGFGPDVKPYVIGLCISGL